MIRLIYTILLFTILASCQNNKPDSSINAPKEQNVKKELQPLSFQTKNNTRQEGDCKTEGAPCVTVDVDVVIANGGKAGVAETINETVSTFLVKTLDFGESEARQMNNLDTAVANVIKEFNIFVGDSGGYPVWEFSIDAATSYQSEQLVSIQFDTYASLGGAHPNSWMDFLNFEAQTGRLLDNKDLVKDKKGLTALAEEKFRAYHKLDPETNLVDAGFDFSHLHASKTEKSKSETMGVFTLPKVIGLKKDKLILCYNAYDIAAYVVGPTVLELSISEAEPFLNKL